MKPKGNNQLSYGCLMVYCCSASSAHNGKEIKPDDGRGEFDETFAKIIRLQRSE